VTQKYYIVALILILINLVTKDDGLICDMHIVAADV
jgi:hypothetical protein